MPSAMFYWMEITTLQLTVGAHPFNCWAVIPYSPFSTVLNFVISHFDILATGTTEEGAKDTRLRV